MSAADPMARAWTEPPTRSGDRIEAAIYMPMATAMIAEYTYDTRRVPQRWSDLVIELYLRAFLWFR
jgi:hypothetical protein